MRTSGSSTSLNRSVSPRPRISSRCQAASACGEQRVGGGLVLEVGAEAALLGQLAERVGAARRLEQVGGDLGVVGEDRRHLPQRLGVVGDHRPAPSAATSSSGPCDAPGEHLGRAVGVDAEAPCGRRARTARPPAGLGGLHGDRDLACRGAPARSVDRARSRTRAVSASSASGAGAAASAEPSASSSRRSGSRSSNWRNMSRSCERSGGGRRTPRGRARRDVALGGGELLGDPRVVGVLGQVLLALGAADLVDVVEHVLERAEALQQLGGGLVADPGDAGDVVAGVALEADEVGDQLRRDPVAVDHALAVVDPGVGDAAAGGHDLHAVVDQLVGVAVAGDDHHLDLRLCGPGLLGDRRDHVVGLVAVDLQVAVAERLDQRLEVRPLLLEQVGPGRPLRLVLGVELLAAGVAGVPDDDRRLRAVVGEDLDQHRGEPEDRVGRHAGRGRDRLRQREERAVGKAVAVDQEELFGDVDATYVRLSRLGAPPPLPIRLRKPGTVGTFLDQALPRWSTPCELATTNRPAPGFVHQPLVPGNLGRTGASERIGRLLGRAHPGAPSPDHPG